MITVGYNGFTGSAELFGRLYRRSGRDRNRVLGHDAGASLFVDGELVAAVEEERLSRQKRTSDFPVGALRRCLADAGIAPDDVDCFAFPWDFSDRVMDEQLRDIVAGPGSPAQKFDALSRLNELYTTLVSREAILADLRTRTGLDVPAEKLLLVPHHLAHLMCGYYLSGGEDAAFLITDGRAEHHSSVMGEVRGGAVTLFDESAIPIRHSLGLLYSKVTRYLGFMPNNDEYKVMGLSAFGSAPAGPNPLLEHVVRLLPGGRYELSFDNVLLDTQSYYGYFDRLFGREVPHEDWDFRVRVARWAQEAVETVTAHQLAHLETRTSMSRLLVEGGVALNCVNNTKLLERSSFAEVCVSFGASDPGVAIGAGFYPSFLAGERPRPVDTPYLGPAFGSAAAEAALRAAGDRVRWERLPQDRLLARTAELLRQKVVVGWFQGRLEYGPRALGHRSILANPSFPDIQDIINVRVKKRETFRPFAPVVLESVAPRVFEMGKKKSSPHMTFVFKVRKEYRDLIAGATHVDGTARIQTISRRQDQALAELLEIFERDTGVPCLLNTSFNVAEEPIVSSPEDALRCFLGTGMDHLVLEDFLVGKNER
ncbi:carbamoyltransferase [Streptomyces fodineus]|uniref:Carbamoyltransferase n=1 Tax=Streptomyces fodineus TaxID=1904616 RepID=A0A1D7YAG7_9ACTN|nr:carbamoyltransferase C-terminal domain-containing protein [Streptomyces fodineus]AOR32329.1 carbamoyltransferase [Streptomyces fodineus]